MRSTMVSKVVSGVPAPVRSDVTEESVLDLVPLARAGWEVTHVNGQARFIGESLELVLPGAGTIPVAPTRVGGDVQNSSVGVGGLTHPMPPQPNRRHRESRGVVVEPHTHPRFIAGHVVDAVGNRLALGVGREIVHAHRWRGALRLPFPAGVLEVPDQFLLLRVDRDHRLSAVRNSSAVSLMCSNCAFRSG